MTTDISGSQTDTTLRGLKPRTTYNIHVLAENAIGRSTRSKILTVTTDDEGKFNTHMLFLTNVIPIVL